MFQTCPQKIQEFHIPMVNPIDSQLMVKKIQDGATPGISWLTKTIGIISTDLLTQIKLEL